jgi:hypothetical protein
MIGGKTTMLYIPLIEDKINIIFRDFEPENDLTHCKLDN